MFHTALTRRAVPDAGRRDRGVGLSGLRPEHTPAHLLRAAEEGAAFAVREGLDAIAALGVDGGEIRISGGVTRRADGAAQGERLGGRPVVAVSKLEATTIGAAILAAVCSGVHSRRRGRDRGDGQASPHGRARACGRRGASTMPMLRWQAASAGGGVSRPGAPLTERLRRRTRVEHDRNNRSRTAEQTAEGDGRRTAGPLDDVRVLDLTRFLSGPLRHDRCSPTSAPTSVKIVRPEEAVARERPADDSRGLRLGDQPRQARHGARPPQRGRAGILPGARGRSRRRLRQLPARGRSTGSGSGMNVCRQANPRIIACEISGFGTPGPGRRCRPTT